MANGGRSESRLRRHHHPHDAPPRAGARHHRQERPDTTEEAQDIRPLTEENDVVDVFAEDTVAEPKQEVEISPEMEAMANEYFEAD